MAMLPYSGLISRGENFEVFVDLLYPHFNHENFRQWNLSGELVLILENISAKSFYYPIHENFPLEINPLYGIQLLPLENSEDLPSLDSIV